MALRVPPPHWGEWKMNNDNQHSDGDLRDSLLAKLEAASSVDALARSAWTRSSRVVMPSVSNPRRIGVDGVVGHLKPHGRNTPSAADVIVEHLLPWCLTTDRLKASSSSDVAFERHRLRELLKDWIYQYPQAADDRSPQPGLGGYPRRLRVRPTRELLWVVASIGFRTPEITAAALAGSRRGRRAWRTRLLARW